MTDLFEQQKDDVVIDAEIDHPEVGTTEIATRETSYPTLSANALIQRAIDSGLQVDSLKELLAMRRELKAEEAREQFFDALAKFQDECPPIEKQKKADKYHYAPFDHIVSVIKPHLKENGFSYTFDAEYLEVGNQQVQRVTCHLHHRAGHTESSVFSAPGAGTRAMNVTQIAASALTYGKRYALCSVLGLTVGNDTDGYVPPEQNGTPDRDANASTAPARDEPEPEVSAIEANNLYHDWKTYREQSGLDQSDEAWFEWFIEATGMPPNIAKNRNLWSASDYRKACSAFDNMAPGLRQQ